MTTKRPLPWICKHQMVMDTCIFCRDAQNPVRRAPEDERDETFDAEVDMTEDEWDAFISTVDQDAYEGD